MANDDQNLVSSPIAGAEIIESDGTVKKVSTDLAEDNVSKTTDPMAFDPEAFESIKALVIRKSAQADEVRSQISELNESLKNILINDGQLATAEEKLKETRVAVQKRKRDLSNSPESQSIRAKMVEFRDELKDLEDSLSTQLLNLYQMTGVQEFETPSGEVREFVIKARVKSKKKK